MNRKSTVIVQNNLKKYFLYTRISNKWTYDKSLEQQEEVCIKTAEQNNIPKEQLIHKEDIESAFGECRRESFEIMMAELLIDSKKKLKDRKYWWIIFYKLDRISRNSEDFQRIESLLNEWYKFISCTETIENSPTGKLLFRMLSAFAIFESEKLSARMIISQIYSILKKDFESTWWRKPFGYHKPKKPNKEGKIEINVKFKNLIKDVYIYYNQIFHYKDAIERLTAIIKSKYRKELESFEWIKWGRFNFYLQKPSEYEKSIITSILDNYVDGAVKYDGCYCKSFKVKDEKIENIIHSIVQDKSSDSDIGFSGELWINQKFKLIMRVPEFEIVNPILYNEVAQKRKTFKQKMKKKNDFWLFDDILFFQKDNWTLIWTYVDPAVRKNKTYYNYRLRIAGGWTADSKSELKIEEVIKYSTQFTRLHNEDRKNKTEKLIWEEFFKTIKLVKESNTKDLVMLKNRYVWLIQQYEAALSESDDFWFATDVKTSIQHYIEEKEKIQNLIDDRKQDELKSLDVFMIMFSPEMFWLDREMKARIYKALCKKIIITADDKVIIEFMPRINELYDFNVQEIVWEIS